jgi:hypothetical protein
MPIVRYFVFIGGLLLALLFVVDQYLPEVSERFAAGDVHRTIIRIRSARPLPEKEVFDIPLVPFRGQPPSPSMPRMARIINATPLR